MSMTSSLVENRFWRVVPPEGVVKNQLGYTCAPNEGCPSYVACDDFAKFVAYGFYCSWLAPDEFSLWELLKKDDIKWLRSYFLDTLEGVIAAIWAGELEAGSTSNDIEQSPDTILNIGNTEEGDEDECMVHWSFDMISKEGQIALSLNCSSTSAFGQENAIWLETEAIQDKAYVRAVIAHARRVNDLKEKELESPITAMQIAYEDVPDLYPAFLAHCNEFERNETYSLTAWYERFGKQ